LSGGRCTPPPPQTRIAALSAQVLRTVEIDRAIAALRAITEHRDDLVRSRTQLINRLRVLLVKLVPSGLSRGLTADSAAEALRRVRPRDTLGRTLRALAVDQVAELRLLDRRTADAAQALGEAVAASGTSLTELLGIGDIVAAKILARTARSPGSRHPRRSRPTAASHRSKCPPATSSGTGYRAQATASSTTRCTSWHWPRSDMTHRAARTTSANEPPERAMRKRCAASNAASPTSSTAP